MSRKKVHHTHEQKSKNSNNYSINKNSGDVVDRFLNVLWRREVDLKLTYK
tara:strand:+ start:290 stop:439 length:150 start_codon:yes stop_codon:yes gene_type:complete